MLYAASNVTVQHGVPWVTIVDRWHFIGRHLIARQLKGDSSSGDY